MFYVSLSLQINIYTLITSKTLTNGLTIFVNLGLQKKKKNTTASKYPIHIFNIYGFTVLCVFFLTVKYDLFLTSRKKIVSRIIIKLNVSRGSVDRAQYVV